MSIKKAKALPFSALYLALVLAAAPFAATAQVPAPAEVLGKTPGDDYYLADYADSVKYFQALAAKSDRIRLFQAGKTSQGRTFHYAAISSAENLARFEHYAEASRRLADSRGLSEAEARALARDSKIIVHIDGGMHASEVADHQLPPVLAHKLLSSPDDPEVAAILDNVILVLWPTLNPDGQDMVAKWYRDQVKGWDTSGPVPKKERDQPMPWLYQEYVGHDNNRDGYMLNMPESRVVIAEEQKYAPAIWYSHHQVAPFPARIWMPPFYDPISQNIHPLMRTWTSNIGINMMSRFEKEGKTGAIAQAKFDNWFPGFLDYIQSFRHTMAYFTEVAHSSATPREYSVSDFPEKYRDLKPQVFYPSPWKGGVWRLRDSVDYMVTASMATLDTAAKYRETLLFNRYLAGKGTIERFSSGNGPYAWVIPATQADPQTAALLAKKMTQHGVEVHQATAPVTLGGTTYPAGSYVLRMDQPFAGLVQELFERQAYPRAFLNEDGTAPKLPYDATGWTLPLQMGVDAVPVNEALPAGLSAKLKRVRDPATPGGLSGDAPVYALSRASNASYAVVNEVLAAGGKVEIATARVQTAQGPEQGAFLVSGLPANALRQIVEKHGVVATANDTPPAGLPLSAPRVGVYRPWGGDHGAMDAGWTEWLLKEFSFAPKGLYNADIKAGLAGKYDAIVLPDLAGGRGGGTPTQRLVDGSFTAGSVPEQYAGGIGSEGVDALKEFLEAGGTVVALNRSSNALIELLDLPVENALAGLSSKDFFCAGALFSVDLAADAGDTVAGLRQQPTVMFNNGPAFRAKPGFNGKVLASYRQQNPLLSGFAVKPETLQGLAAAVELPYGKGKVVLYGFAPQWRAQPHGTFKFVFNPLYKHG